MFLMDDTLFKLWREGVCEKEEVLLKSAKPLELADRIRAAEEGTFDEDEDADDQTMMMTKMTRMIVRAARSVRCAGVMTTTTTMMISCGGKIPILPI